MNPETKIRFCNALSRAEDVIVDEWFEWVKKEGKEAEAAGSIRDISTIEDLRHKLECPEPVSV